MTNKVKPFFIRITDDMTPQMVQDAFDKCINAVASPDECVAGTNKNHKYQDSYGNGFNYLGTSIFCGTYLADDFRSYGEDAQEITLDQLDEWLGLEVEWNGEGLPPVGFECEFKEKSPSGVSVFSNWSKCRVLAYNNPKKPSNEIQIIIRDDRGDAAIIYSCDEPVFRKPETPEQKAERERLEAAYDLYTHVQSVRGQLSCGFDWFSDSEMEETRLRFLAIVDKTGYRKK